LKSKIIQIVSGGQTGVDRAALDFALEFGIPCGGWCPRGRKAEDGPIPSVYPLKETESTDYPVRTEKNILDSDGTLILYYGTMDRGTILTQNLAQKHQKPLFTIDIDNGFLTDEFYEWIDIYHIRVLNIAGPRESHSRGIYNDAYDTLKYLFL
jgi:hypothetical protein